MTASRRMVLILTAALLAAACAGVVVRIQKRCRALEHLADLSKTDDLLARREIRPAPAPGAVWDVGLFPREADFRDALNAVNLLPIGGRPQLTGQESDSFWILRIGADGKAGVEDLIASKTDEEERPTTETTTATAPTGVSAPGFALRQRRRNANLQNFRDGSNRTKALGTAANNDERITSSHSDIYLAGEDSTDSPSARKSKNLSRIEGAKSLDQRLAPLFHPIILSRTLGLNAIRPPREQGPAPSFAHMEKWIPHYTERGDSINPAPPSLKVMEGISPPDGISGLDCKPEYHWHRLGTAQYRHSGSAWGRWDGTHWVWLKKPENQWWQRSHNDSSSEQPPLLWHASHWWWQNNDSWFLIHEGEPWAYRFMDEWRQEGLIHPPSDTRMVYSADGSRVALVTPGRGAALYDAYTGRELAHWTEEEMPRRRQPKAPASLIFPRN